MSLTVRRSTRCSWLVWDSTTWTANPPMIVVGLADRPVDQHGPADDAGQHADRGQAQPDVDQLAGTCVVEQPAHPGDRAVPAREGHLDDRAGGVRKSEDRSQQEGDGQGGVLPTMMPAKTTLIINPGNAESTGMVSSGISGPASRIRKPARTLVGM
jgi:hypothetical protein